MSLARHLQEFRFKGIFGIEDKFFTKFPFSQKSSGIMVLCECTSEEFRSSTSELSVPKNFEESSVVAPEPVFLKTDQCASNKSIKFSKIFMYIAPILTFFLEIKNF